MNPVEPIRIGLRETVSLLKGRAHVTPIQVKDVTKDWAKTAIFL